MAPAVAGDIASSAEYNKLIANILDLDKRAFSQVTSSTRPASPTLNQVIYETDTGVIRMWDGSYWRGLNSRVFRVSSTADLQLTNTSQAVPGGSITFATTSPNAQVDVIGTFDMEMTVFMVGTGYKYGQVLLNGTEMNGGRRVLFNSAGTGRFTLGQQWSQIIPSPTTVTITMRGYQDGSNATSYIRGPSTLQITVRD